MECFGQENVWILATVIVQFGYNQFSKSPVSSHKLLSIMIDNEAWILDKQTSKF